MFTAALLASLALPQGPLTNTQLVDLMPVASSLPDNFTRFGWRALFFAESPGQGREPWVTDGTVAGTQVLGDLLPGFSGSWTSQLDLFPGVTSQGALIAPANAATGTPLWITDGTPAGTQLLLDLYPGIASKQIRQGVELDGRVLLAVVGSFAFSGLWITDGTPAGTVLLKEFVNLNSLVRGTGALSGRVFFSGRAVGEGFELWETDGTSAGTKPVADLVPGDGSSSPSLLVASGDRIYFTATTPATGRELFSTGGDAASTGLIQELIPGPGEPTWFSTFAFDGQIFIDCTGTATTGRELWRYSPQSNQLAQVFDPTPGSGQASQPYGFVASGGRLFFLSRSGPDGQPAPYRLFTLTNGAALPQIVAPDLLVEDGPFVRLLPLGESGRVVLPARSEAPGPDLGIEWFVSDGTPAGTQQMADSLPGSGDGAKADFSLSFTSTVAVAGDRLVFSASDGTTGLELHSVPFAATGAWLAESFGFGCGGFGSPRAQALNAPILGQQFLVGLSAATPLAPALLEIAPNAQQLPVEQLLGPGVGAGCTLYLAGSQFLGSAQTDATGNASLSLQLPANPALVGLDFYLQWLSLTPGGPILGAAELSSALAVLVAN
jgi:ELWxxDGT repeat protein